MTHVVVYTKRRILRTPHPPILVTLAQLERARRIPQLCRLGQQLARILEIDKEYVIDSPFMEEREFMQRVWEFRRRVFGGSFEPLDAFLWTHGEAEGAVEFSCSEAVHGAGV